MADPEHVRIVKGDQPHSTYEWQQGHPSGRLDLRGADLSDLNLRHAWLIGADLRDANLYRADLSGAALKDANLRKARLEWARLGRTSLEGADLRDTDLLCTAFDACRMQGVNLAGASCHFTLFTSVDLLRVKGLGRVVHKGRSSVGIDTLVESKGRIPPSFLRGCGFSEEQIKSVPALIQGRDWFELQIPPSRRRNTFG